MGTLKKLGYGITFALLIVGSCFIKDYDTHIAKKKQIRWAVEDFDRRRPEAIFNIGGKVTADSTSMEEKLEEYNPNPNLLSGIMPADLKLDIYSFNRDSTRLGLRGRLEANLPKGFTLRGEVITNWNYDSGDTKLKKAKLWVEKSF
jgi:hypothetical protein